MLTRKIASLLVAAAWTLVFAPPMSAAPPEGVAAGKAKHANSIYIVRMAGAPVVAYDGDVRGYAATRPKRGQKIDPNSNAVVRYMEYLAASHDDVAGRVNARKVYSYGYAINGFAAEMGKQAAAQLAAMPGVLSVEKDDFAPLETATTPAFLGLSAAGGLWDQVGGVGRAGEGVIIGIVDGGIWPEHLSFSDRTGTNGNATKDGKLSYRQIPGWHGKCTPGEQFNASHCNQKLIGARYYNAGFGGNAGIDAEMPWEFNSPRDFGGHGTHTASTAGGNANVVITGTPAALGTQSGIAPRARIAAYKACWQTAGGGLCAFSDTVAAIDQAVADGVDVINYSIGGSRTNFLSSVAVAMLFAADAGVFVAASAGNSGPSSFTVAHPGPWMTTVAAGTHDRYFEADAHLGNGATYRGASVNEGGLPMSPFIYAGDAPAAGASVADAARCFADTLDAAKVAGKIVLCDRGVIARVDKSAEVKRAGGIGMIHRNVAPSSLNADFHSVPTVHVDHVMGAAIHTYVAGNASAMARMDDSFFSPQAAPFTAGFSSRGPLQAGGGNLLKPDVIAPGQDIMAGVAPPGNGGELFASYSGTSMSSPHVAGLAALLKNLHPGWSPMMIKSALMTTAGNVLDGPDTNPVVIFRQGAGHVRPNSAGDPGLVFGSGFLDWLGFLCGTGQLVAPFCPGLAIHPSDLNVASIAIGAMTGSQTVRRTARNVGGAPETYTASVTGMSGFAVTLPAPFTVTPGATRTFEVGFTRNTATIGSYAGGQLTLTGDKGHVVRLPIVVRPVALDAPAGVSGSGGDITYDVRFGYSGAFGASPRGLMPATTTPGNVTQDPDQTFNPADPAGTTVFDFVVPAGRSYVRFSLFDAFTDGNDDLDLYVYNPGGTLVGASTTATSAEQVNLLNPAAGTYKVYVHGWRTDGPDSNFTLFSWMLGTTPASNMAVDAPAAAVQGETGQVRLTFSGLAPATKYLGSVAYSGTSGLPNPTIVSVDTP